jgi:hypothetical protein
MSVDGKDDWIENKADSYFDEIQKKYYMGKDNEGCAVFSKTDEEIEEECLKKAEEDYQNSGY